MITERSRPDWTTTARDRTITAIQEGRTDDAIKGVDEIWAEGRPIHDLYGEMSAVFLDFISEELGEEAVERAWRYLGEKLWRPIFTQLADAGPEVLASTYAMFLRSHGYDFRVEEDDQKFTFFLDYCPSGQRMLVEGKAEGDDRNPLNLGVSKKPYPWSFGKEGVLYYCGHTKLWFDEQPKEWGMPVMSTRYGDFDPEGRVVGMPCMAFVYKRAPQSE